MSPRPPPKGACSWEAIARYPPQKRRSLAGLSVFGFVTYRVSTRCEDVTLSCPFLVEGCCGRGGCKRLISLTIFAANQREQGKNRKNSRRHGKNREFSPARE